MIVGCVGCCGGLGKWVAKMFIADMIKHVMPSVLYGWNDVPYPPTHLPTLPRTQITRLTSVNQYTKIIIFREKRLLLDDTNPCSTNIASPDFGTLIEDAPVTNSGGFTDYALGYADAGAVL